jgi:hypothetical protein
MREGYRAHRQELRQLKDWQRRFIFSRRYTKTGSVGVYKIKKLVQEPDIMDDHEITDGKMPPFLIAGLGCLFCLPVIYLTTRPLFWLLHHARWVVWPFFTLWTLVPIMVAFVVLYRSAWHREWPRSRRIFSMIFSSCIIFGVDLVVVVMLLAAGCLIAGLTRVMGGN